MTSHKVELYTSSNIEEELKNAEEKSLLKAKLLVPKPVRSPLLNEGVRKELPKMVFSPIYSTSRLSQLRSLIKTRSSSEDLKDQSSSGCDKEESKNSSTA